MRINNSELIQGIVDSAKLSSTSGIVSELEPKVTPSMECNSFLLKPTHKTQSITSSATGAMTITLPTNRDIYITGYQVSVIKDVTCDSTTGRYQIYTAIDGANTDLGNIAIIASTAQNATYSHSFSRPLKIDKNGTVNMSGTFTAGVCVRTLTIFYFTVENIRA